MGDGGSRRGVRRGLVRDGVPCPLAIWLVYRYRSEFVRLDALESLNFQLSLLMSTAVAVVLILITFGAPSADCHTARGDRWSALVVIILATMAASSGREYRYPLTIRLVR